MRIKYEGTDCEIDFSKLHWQRQYVGWTGRSWLAYWYVMIQSLAALFPGKLPLTDIVHEGLGRHQISGNITKRTGRYIFTYGAFYLVPGLYTPEIYSRSRIWMLRGCGWRTCRAVLASLWREQWHASSPIMAELAYRAIPYMAFFRHTGASQYVTTSTGQFPESPAVAVANGMGLKTILWQYGVQHVLPTTERPLRWDVPAAMRPAISEIHVWSEWAKTLWLSNYHGMHPPNIVVDGPRMLGHKPQQFPMSQVIGVADTPAKRIPHGLFTQDWVDRFYAHLYTIAIRNPGLTFLVKTKYDAPTLAPSFMRQRLCRLSNVDEVHADRNPWTLIERCGTLVCLPYSSMGVAALAVGRTVWFYDPTGEARYYPDPAVHAHYVTGEAALENCLLRPRGIQSPANGGDVCKKQKAG